jgi:hypothetical protein
MLCALYTDSEAAGVKKLPRLYIFYNLPGGVAALPAGVKPQRQIAT